MGFIVYGSHGAHTRIKRRLTTVQDTESHAHSPVELVKDQESDGCIGL